MDINFDFENDTLVGFDEKRKNGDNSYIMAYSDLLEADDEIHVKFIKEKNYTLIKKIPY